MRVIIIFVLLILLVPVFSYLCDSVNYSEPLENIAKMLNVKEETIYKEIFPEYQIKGFNKYLAGLITAPIGMGLVFLLVYILLIGVGKMLSEKVVNKFLYQFPNIITSCYILIGKWFHR